MRGHVSAVAGALLASLAVAGVADAQGVDRGQFGISPSRRNLVGRPPASLGTTQVTNTSRKTFDVTVAPVLLRQNLDGGFSFPEDPRSLREAGLIISTSPQRFTLGPNSAHAVRLSWDRLPSGTRAAYIGVVFTGVPKLPNGQPIKEIDRLVGLTFLRLPGKYRTSGLITDVRGTQSAPRVLTFPSTVENTGEIITTPQHGHIVITDASGRQVLRAPWQGDIILPKAKRAFPTIVKKVIPAGTYTVTTSARVGGKPTRKASKFTLVGPNQLPTPELSLQNLAAKETLGDPANVSGLVRSTGSAPTSTEVSLTLSRLKQGVQGPPIATRRVPFKKLAPKSTAPLRAQFPSQPRGNYRVIARYRDAAGAVQTLSADFSPLAPSKKKSSGLGTGAIAAIGLGLLALLALALLLLRRRRRGEDDDDDDAAAPAGTPPVDAAPAADGVDLNTASEEELQALPGVGPAAARRIVAHREEYGRFGSVDDLLAVEGFGATRVEALRPLVR